MKQQINLYVRQEKQKSVPFSALSCALIVVVSTGLLLGVFAYNWQSQERLRVEVAEQKKEQRRLQKQFDKTREKLVVKKLSPALKAELRDRQKELEAKKRFEGLLDRLQPGRSVSFSQLLQGLSSQAVEGIWLTRIQAMEAGRALNLEGGTLKAELVPRYLKALGNEAVYQRSRFDQLQLRGADTGLRFQVAGVLPKEGAQ